MGNKYTSEYWSNRGIGLNVLRAQHGRYVTGSIYFVKKTSDSDYQSFVNLHYEDTVYTTIAKAITAATSNLGDFICVDKGTYTEALTVSKNDLTLRGLGSTPYSTVIDGDGSVAVTVTGVDTAFENLHIKTSGAAVNCLYGTGLVGAPNIQRCVFTQTGLTSSAAVNIAGATSRALFVAYCQFIGNNTNADAVNDAGQGGFCLHNASDGFNTTEATCFGTANYYGNSAT